MSYRFGDDLCVDVTRLAVTRAGTPVSLEPKAFDVLRLLIEHRDRLVTKDELLDTVWRDTFVTPNVLTRAIAQLRKALGDDAQDARYIATVTKRGYRFIADVTVEPAASNADASTAAASKLHASAVAGADGQPPSAPSASSPRLDLPATPPAPARPRGALQLTAMAVVVIAVLAGAAWVARARMAIADAVAAAVDRHPLPPKLPSPHRITTRNGNNNAPAISPDGRAIAYVSDYTGALEIYVVGLAPGSQDMAITKDRGQNVEPAWSPDGQWIAFHSRVHGGVWIVPATGGAPRQIVDRGSRPAWSPDGQSIAFTSYEGSSAGQSVIRIASRDGSSVRDVTHLGDPVGGHINPSWSTSGRYLAFAVTNGVSSRSLWIVPAAGGAPHRLTEMAGANDPQFGPGDRALFFQGWEIGTNSSNRLFRLPLDTTQIVPTPAGPPIEIMSIGADAFTGLSIARDGTLAYGLGTTDANLWAIDVRPDGSSSDPVRLTDDAIRATSPDFSKDGRLAYAQMGTGRPSSVWIMGDDASRREPLSAEGPAAFPTWSHDGQRVLVLGNSGGGAPALWWIDLMTRRTTRLGLAADGVRSPRVSPDGRELAFWAIEPNGAMNVWAQAMDGSASRRRVTADAEAITYPSWSPDGRFLAVEVKRGERTHVGIVSAAGGAIEQLTDESGQSWPHSWSPDGEQIAYAAERDGVWNVHTVSRRTHLSRALTHFTSPSGYVRYPSWSPRGTRIVFERETHASGIWTLRPIR